MGVLSDMAKYQLVWDKMAELGIASITVSFSGEGDSGSINDVSPIYVDGSESSDYAAGCEAFRAVTVDVDVGEDAPRWMFANVREDTDTTVVEKPNA